MKKLIFLIIAVLSFSFVAEGQLYHAAKKLKKLIQIGKSGMTDSLIIYNAGTRIDNGVLIKSTLTVSTLAISGIEATGRIMATVTTEQLRLRYDASNYATWTVAADGALTIATVDAAAAEGDINFTPDGYVGIKTAVPTVELDVTGAIKASGTVSGATYGSNGTVSDAELLYINSLSSNAQDQITAKAPLAAPVFTSTGSFESTLTINPTVADTEDPSFIIKGDADSDGTAFTSEALTINLTAATNPINAIWGFTSTQGAGYKFDGDIQLTSSSADQMVYPGSDAGTTGMIASATTAFVSSNGPYFILRGNDYTQTADQEGSVFIVAGDQGGFGATEGAIRIYTGIGGAVERLTISKEGLTTLSGLLDGNGTSATANNTLADTLALTGGALELSDEQSVTWGGAGDWKAYFDDDVDDQLIFETTATTASTDDDALLMFLYPASPDADQELFEIAKGTQSSKTSLFKVDEDGDVGLASGASLISAGDILLSAGGGVIIQLAGGATAYTKNLLSYTDNTYDLGSPTYRFNDLFLGGNSKTGGYNRSATTLFTDCFDLGADAGLYNDRWDITTLNVTGAGTNVISTKASHITLTTDGNGANETEGTKSFMAVIDRLRKNRSKWVIELAQTATTNFYMGWNTQATNTVAADDKFVMIVYEVGQANWQLWIDDGADGDTDKYVSDVAVDTDDIAFELTCGTDGTIRFWINDVEKTHGLTEVMQADAHFLIVGQLQTTDNAARIAEVDYILNEKYLDH